MVKKKVKKKASNQAAARIPTEKQIGEGLYFDFEGFGSNKYMDNPTPVLCGYRFGGSGPVRFAVFNDAFRWAAEAEKSGLVEFVGRGEKKKDFLMDLIERRTRGGKKVFYYSSHEKDEFDRILGIQIRRRLRDVRRIMKKTIPGLRHGERTLINYCGEAGIDVPLDYGKGEVTKKFRNVRDYSKTRSGWSNAPAGIVKQWQLILDHNRFDVESMYHLVRRVVQMNKKS